MSFRLTSGFVVRATVAVVLMLFTALAFGVGSQLVEQAYNGDGWQLLAEQMKNRHEHSCEHYVREWQKIVVCGAITFVFVWCWWEFLSRRELRERVVGTCTARELGVMRSVVGSILVASAIWEHIGSTVYIPEQEWRPFGVMKLVAMLPGFEEFRQSAACLELYDLATVVVLVLATVGLWTRITVPLGGAMYLLLAGLLRSYSWPYHTGVMPFYAMMMLACTPCGDGFSIDAVRRGLRRSEASYRYAWGRFCVWTIIAVPMLMAGISKLRHGGLGWLEADSFLGNTLPTAVTPMQFEFNLGVYLVDLPRWMVSSMATTAVAIQLLCIAIPFSRRSRRILPVLLVIDHVAIWLLMNILFFDSIILFLLVFDWKWLLQWKRANVSHVSNLRGTSQSRRWSQVALVGLLSVMMLVWTGRQEFFPLTSMQMFSRYKPTSSITYYKMFAHYEDGRVERAPIESVVGAMADSRYRRLLASSFSERSIRFSSSETFFKTCGTLWNDRWGVDGKRMQSIEIQRWQWDFRDAAQRESLGTCDATHMFAIPSEKHTSSTVQDTTKVVGNSQ